MDTGKVMIHNKEYQTVAFRIQTFKGKYPEHSIETEIIQRDEFWDLDGCWWEKRTERYGIQWIQGEPVERRDFRPDDIVRRK